jgi:hypothetical protein
MSTRQTKNRLILLVILCSLPQLAFSIDIYLPTRYESLYGIWVNPDYPPDSDVLPQRIAIWNWGYGEAFHMIGSDKPYIRWTQIILSKRQDSEGATWYRTYERVDGSPTPEIFLYKVSKEADKLEYVWALLMSSDMEKTLTESSLVPDNAHYMSYTRK